MKFFVCTWLCLLCGCALPYRADRATHWLRLYRGRADGLILEAACRDTARGGGLFLFTDPRVQAINATHVNQPAIGGGNVFRMGASSVVVDPQTAAVIGAGGTAIGNVIGAAAKSAIGKP